MTIDLREIASSLTANQRVLVWVENDLVPHQSSIDFVGLEKRLHVRASPPEAGLEVDTIAYNQILGLFVFWYFNLRNDTEPDEQLDYLTGKCSTEVQLYYVMTLCFSEIPKSKELIGAVITRGIPGLSNFMIAAFDRSPEFWGDISAHIDVKVLTEMTDDARDTVAMLAEKSSNDAFKLEVVNLLWNDPYSKICGFLREAVRRGAFPKPTKG